MCTSAARCERDEKPAVLVIGGEEIGRHQFLLAGARPHLELLPEPANTPFERDLRRVLLGLEAAEPEPVDDVRPEQLLLSVADELEDTAAGGEDPSFLVADDEAGVRRGVVVVHQLEEEAESAALAGDRDVVELLQPVVVDGALLAVGADEEGHELKVALDPSLPPEEPQLADRRRDDQAPRPHVAPLPAELGEVVAEV